MNFDTKPSFKLDKQPIVSIIIPCYNTKPKNMDKLLNSIVEQDLKDKIEVIISDDLSTDLTYLEIVDKYLDKISIKGIQTDYNFAPGNTREKGTTIAEGEWYMFADHDDQYVPGSIKKMIEEINKQETTPALVVANFIEYDPEDDFIIQRFKQNMNWNHAKMYNVNKLWKKYDIHFKKDLLSHEDIYISSMVNSILSGEQLQPLFLDIDCYIWTYATDTLSRKPWVEDGEKKYNILETRFDDYIESTGEVYLDMFKKQIPQFQDGITLCMQIIGYCYFYFESLIFKYGMNDKYAKKNIKICKKYLKDFKELLQVDNEIIYHMYADNDAFVFGFLKENADIATGPYIPQHTFMQWLEMMSKDEEE